MKQFMLAASALATNLTACATPSYLTCPIPSSIHKIVGNHPVLTGFFAAPNHWRSQPIQNFAEYYQKVPKIFAKKIRFVRATLYQHQVVCEYTIHGIQIILVKEISAKPRDDQHWHSAGFSVSNRHFEIFECGHGYNYMNNSVSYCKFVGSKST